VFSEGTTFFTIENTKKESSYASIEAMKIHNSLSVNEVGDFISNF